MEVVDTLEALRSSLDIHRHQDPLQVDLNLSALGRRTGGGSKPQPTGGGSKPRSFQDGTGVERTVGVVPTMGALHDGHMALLQEARVACDVLVVTIFVNATQFNEAADFSAYPRTLEQDLLLCEKHGADIVFAPGTDAMYPKGFQTWVEVSGLTRDFEGIHRPNHFRGVATIVTKLLSLTAPCTAWFGQKDYQQLKVIEQLAKDLNLQAAIASHPTVREASGLARSSRNQRLSEHGRHEAAALSKGLFSARDAFRAGERNSAILVAEVMKHLKKFERIDYVSVATQEELSRVDFVTGPCVILAAAHIEGVRLIDNILLD